MAQPVIVNDTFTNATAQTLTAHVPDTGTSWVYSFKSVGVTTPGSDITVGAGTGTCWALDEWGGGCQVYTSRPDPPTAEYDVILNMSAGPSAIAAADDPVVLVARWTAFGDCYYVKKLQSASTADEQIWKQIGGTNTQLATGDSGFADTDKLTFEVRNTLKRFLKNDIQRITTTDNTITTIGNAGFGMGNINATLAEDTSMLYKFTQYQVLGPDVAAPAITAPTILATFDNVGVRAATTGLSPVDTPWSCAVGDIIVIAVGCYDSNTTTFTNINMTAQSHTGTWSWTSVVNPILKGAESACVKLFIAKAPAGYNGASGTTRFGYSATGAAPNPGYWRYTVLKLTNAKDVFKQSGVVDHTTGTTASITLGLTPATTSIVLGVIFDTGSSGVPIVAPYTLINDIQSSGTSFQMQYDLLAPTVTCNWTSLSNNGMSPGIGVEIEEAVVSTTSKIRLGTANVTAVYLGDSLL